MMPQARDGYARAATPVRTDRSAEYAIFARVTAALAALDEGDRSQFPSIARAITENQRLWSALADDLLRDGNRLPVELRAQLLGIAEFVRRHSMEVLARRGSVAALVDINTAIMKGLRGQVEAAA